MKTTANLEKLITSLEKVSALCDKVYLEWKISCFMLVPCITTITITNYHTVYRERDCTVVYEVVFDARTGEVRSIMHTLNE